MSVNEKLIEVWNKRKYYVKKDLDIKHKLRKNKVKRISEEEFNKLPIVRTFSGIVDNCRINDKDLEIYTEYDPGMYLNIPIYTRLVRGVPTELFSFRCRYQEKFSYPRLTIAFLSFEYDSIINDSLNAGNATYQIRDESKPISKDNVDIVGKRGGTLIGRNPVILRLEEDGESILTAVHKRILDYYTLNKNIIEITLSINNEYKTKYSSKFIEKIIKGEIFNKEYNQYILMGGYIKSEFLKGRFIKSTSYEYKEEELDLSDTTYTSVDNVLGAILKALNHKNKYTLKHTDIALKIIYSNTELENEFKGKVKKLIDSDKDIYRLLNVFLTNYWEFWRGINDDILDMNTDYRDGMSMQDILKKYRISENTFYRFVPTGKNKKYSKSQKYYYYYLWGYITNRPVDLTIEDLGALDQEKHRGLLKDIVIHNAKLEGSYKIIESPKEEIVNVEEEIIEELPVITKPMKMVEEIIEEKVISINGVKIRVPDDQEVEISFSNGEMIINMKGRG